jgi:hypothetical protein
MQGSICLCAPGVNPKSLDWVVAAHLCRDFLEDAALEFMVCGFAMVVWGVTLLLCMTLAIC